MTLKTIFKKISSKFVVEEKTFPPMTFTTVGHDKPQFAFMTEAQQREHYRQTNTLPDNFISKEAKIKLDAARKESAELKKIISNYKKPVSKPELKKSNYVASRKK